MGLSEHEQRVLDELERGLYAEDELLARRIQKAANQTPDRLKQRSAARRIAGALVALAGLGVILVGAITHYAWMGAGGFVVTLLGLLLATTSGKAVVDAPQEPVSVASGARQSSAATASSAGSRPAKKSWFSSLNDFFEERWDRRNGL
ncbi:MAG: DUF3040 domain-containing protein [Actinomycetales bacterium]|nr:DUF3040 domain-containing protein [Actinomycetales bacterium]